MAIALITLPATVLAGSPSADITATLPAVERSAGATMPGMHCYAAIKAAGKVAQSGPHAELQARHDAIQIWRTQVAERYGHDYTQWWRARDKDVQCQANGGGMRCEALAVPCMAQGGSATLSGLGMIERR